MADTTKVLPEVRAKMANNFSKSRKEIDVFKMVKRSNYFDDMDMRNYEEKLFQVLNVELAKSVSILKKLNVKKIVFENFSVSDLVVVQPGLPTSIRKLVLNLSNVKSITKEPPILAKDVSIYDYEVIEVTETF